MQVFVSDKYSIADNSFSSNIWLHIQMFKMHEQDSMYVVNLHLQPANISHIPVIIIL